MPVVRVKNQQPAVRLKKDRKEVEGEKEEEYNHELVVGAAVVLVVVLMPVPVVPTRVSAQKRVVFVQNGSQTTECSD